MQSREKNHELASFARGSTKLSLVQGNIVLENSDAIVNAANEDLWFGSGVADAIRSAAGK